MAIKIVFVVKSVEVNRLQSQLPILIILYFKLFMYIWVSIIFYKA